MQYFMFGLAADASVFFYTYLVTLVLASVYASLGMFIAAAMPTFEVAQALLGILGPLFFLFGGLWSPPPQMTAGARWFCYIDPITYAFQSIIPPHFYCDTSTPAAAAACPRLAVPGVGSTPLWPFVQSKYGLENSKFPLQQTGFLCIFIVVFQLGHILAVSFVRRTGGLARRARRGHGSAQRRARASSPLPLAPLPPFSFLRRCGTSCADSQAPPPC